MTIKKAVKLTGYKVPFKSEIKALKAILFSNLSVVFIVICEGYKASGG